VAGCVSLEYINCFQTQISNLNLTGLQSLKTLDCGYCKLSELNVKNLSALETLYCNGNQLSTLDVSDLANLQTLICNNNKIKSLNLSNCISLCVIDCYGNQLNELDVSNMMLIRFVPTDITQSSKAIDKLEIISTKIKPEGLSKIGITPVLPEWTHITLPKKYMKEIFSSALTTLICTNNPFTKLELSNINLREITFGNNSLTSVNLMKCEKLETINFENWDQYRPDLDLSGHTQFNTIHIASLKS